MVIPEPIDRSLGDLPTRTQSELASTVRIGDPVFIRLRYPPFKAIASATGTWTNHVGIVVDLNRRMRISESPRAPVPPPPALDSLSLPLEQDARLYRGDAEWRNS